MSPRFSVSRQRRAIGLVSPAPDPTQARHLAWLEEAGAMTMALARKAHERAMAQLDPPSPAEPQAPTAKDETLRFTRLVAAIRQIIAAEARIAAGAPTPAAARRPVHGRSPTANDPRHALLRSTLHRAVRNDPDGARIRRAIDHELEHELAADPARLVSAGNLLATVADRLAIPLDLAKLPDELLPDDPDDEDDDLPVTLLTPTAASSPSPAGRGSG